MICEKIPYLSKEDAIKVLHNIQNEKKNKKKPVRCYQCDKCKRWHLTSKEILTEKAKPVRLKHADEWNSLLTRQQNREELFGEKPFERQIEKALSVITHNINVQCEILEDRFRFRMKKIRYNFNRTEKELLKKIA